MRGMRISILVGLGMSGILNEAGLWWLGCSMSWTVGPSDRAPVGFKSLQKHRLPKSYQVRSIKEEVLVYVHYRCLNRATSSHLAINVMSLHLAATSQIT